MLLVHGRYRFGLRKIGARKDFCNACERECLSELWRSFDCGHLFWVPLLPLGPRERWRCTLCANDPRARYKTGRFAKIGGLFATAVFFAAVCSVEPKADDVNFMWGARIFFALAFLGFLYSLLKRKPAVTEDARRSAVVPLSSETCLYCRGPLNAEPHLHCPACQIQIYTEQPPVRASAPSYPENNIEAVLAQPNREEAMSGFLASMENESLWVNPVARRVGCLGILYWRVACDGIAAVISENGPTVVKEAMVILQELGAEKSVKAWKDIFALFPGGAPPDDYPDCETAMAQVLEQQEQKLRELGKAFDKAFHDEENVLARLHTYIGLHKAQFQCPAQTPIR